MRLYFIVCIFCHARLLLINFTKFHTAFYFSYNCAYDDNYDFVTSFWRTKAVVTSHFAVGILTDFLAKARRLGRDVNFICH